MINYFIGLWDFSIENNSSFINKMKFKVNNELEARSKYLEYLRENPKLNELFISKSNGIDIRFDYGATRKCAIDEYNNMDGFGYLCNSIDITSIIRAPSKELAEKIFVIGLLHRSEPSFESRLMMMYKASKRTRGIKDQRYSLKKIKVTLIDVEPYETNIDVDGLEYMSLVDLDYLLVKYKSKRECIEVNSDYVVNMKHNATIDIIISVIQDVIDKRIDNIISIEGVK